MKSISIIGCGWLGLPLAQKLISHNLHVMGTTTSLDKLNYLTNIGIEAFGYMLGDKLPVNILNSEAIIIAIPPRGIDYLNNLRTLQRDLSNYQKQIIFISSTSVYADTGKIVFEHEAIDIPSPHTGISLLQAENIFVDSQLNTTVVRFAGLFGPERQPGKFWAGKKDVVGFNNPVNLIHLEDCIGLIIKIIETGVTNTIYNGCAPIHPSRKEFYTKAASLLGLDAPEFNDKAATFKIIDSSKGIEELKYTYKYPNPIDGLVAV